MTKTMTMTVNPRMNESQACKSRAWKAWQELQSSNPRLLSRMYGMPHRSRNSLFLQPDAIKITQQHSSQERCACEDEDEECSRRNAALKSIAQVLCPPLENDKGEMGRRMAKFKCALSTSVHNNEILHCEEEVRSRMKAMSQGLAQAQHHSCAFSHCLSDLEHRISNISLVSEDEMREMELELEKMRLTRIQTMHGLKKIEMEASESVENLRSALEMAEIAWLKNLEDAASCLLLTSSST